ncbi:MAG: glycosyltransferase family 2 protein [Bacteroidota bacterium]
MVTVIIPVYNAEKTIGRAIKSVIIQPYVNQLILVNDASTDNCSLLMDYYKDKYFSPDRGIKLDIIQQKTNEGVSISRNKGLEYVLSPFLTFLDADDEFLPSRFCKDMPLLLSNETIAGIYAQVQIVYDGRDAQINHEKVSNEKEWIGAIKEDNSSLFSKFLGCADQYFLLSGLLIRTRSISQIGFFDPSLLFCQDTDWLLRVIAAFTLLPSENRIPTVKIWRHAKNRILTPSLPAKFRLKMLWKWLPFVLTRNDFTFKQRFFYVNSLLENPEEYQQSKKSKMLGAIKWVLRNPRVFKWMLKG